MLQIKSGEEPQRREDHDGKPQRGISEDPPDGRSAHASKEVSEKDKPELQTITSNLAALPPADAHASNALSDKDRNQQYQHLSEAREARFRGALPADRRLRER